MAAVNFSVTTIPAFSALSDGIFCVFRASEAGGGGDFLSVNGTPFYPLVKQVSGSGVDVAVVAGDIQSGGLYPVCFNGSLNSWVVMGGI